MRIYKIEKTASNACPDVLTKWDVKRNDVALSVSVWLFCFLWHVFQLVAEVAIS